MSIADCIENESLTVTANTFSEEPAVANTVKKAVVQLSTGETVVGAKVAQSELVETLDTHAVTSDRTCVIHLEQLEAKRKNWEGAELAASHARLYAILSSVYAYYCKMKDAKTDKAVRDHMRKGLEEFAAARELTIQNGTPDMNIVVKAVFGSQDRRRVSAYSRALRVAHDNSVLPVDLAAWIKQQGGVEEIRKSASANAQSLPAKDRAAIVKGYVQGSTLETFKTSKLAKHFGASDSNKVVVLVATYRATGELDIQGVVKTDRAVNAALATYYSDHKAEITKAEKAASIAKRSPINAAQSA